MSVKSDWFGMSSDERSFTLRIYQSGVGSGKGLSCYSNDGIALWKNPEKLCFLECIGSYKWVCTDKFKGLADELFLI